MTDFQTMILGCMRNPKDETARLVLADKADELGRATLADGLRGVGGRWQAVDLRLYFVSCSLSAHGLGERRRWTGETLAALDLRPRCLECRGGPGNPRHRLTWEAHPLTSGWVCPLPTWCWLCSACELDLWRRREVEDEEERAADPAGWAARLAAAGRQLAAALGVSEEELGTLAGPGNQNL